MISIKMLYIVPTINCKFEELHKLFYYVNKAFYLAFYNIGLILNGIKGFIDILLLFLGSSFKPRFFISIQSPGLRELIAVYCKTVQAGKRQKLNG